MSIIRVYNHIINGHLQTYQQMAFLSGPRQVGKTTVAMGLQTVSEHYKYLNWDVVMHREQILASYTDAVNGLPVEAVLDTMPVIVFDEIHKYVQWKTYLKGFVDSYKHRLHIIVTGSAKMNVYAKGGDSLMGRYFLYRMHPLSVREIIDPTPPIELISLPKKIENDAFEHLFNYGGFPEVFSKANESFYNIWQNLRQQQMFKEDIRDLSQIYELSQFEVLAAILKNQTGQLTKYNQLAKKVRVSDQTIRRWISVLESLYYCFTIRPWSRNIVRSLLKEPKIYLWDWSIVSDKGAKIENFVACHLLKAIHFWNDTGRGVFSLHYIRDKDKNEVDFLIVKNDEPWVVIEVKSSDTSISKNLYNFKNKTNAKHAFQLCFDMPYVDRDCFEFDEPVIVSLKTFLSQLI